MSFKRLFLILATLCVLLGCAPLGLSQTTQVSGTVLAPNGLAWQAGTGNFSIQCPQNEQPYVNGSVIPRNIPLVRLDGNGAFSQQLYDTSFMTDINNQPLTCSWKANFLDNCGVATFGVTFTGITGASVNVTSQISAVSVPLSAACTPASVPNTIIVVPGQSVQAAINIACSQGGATILIANGTYVGPTTFCSNVILQAIVPNQPDICQLALGSHTNCPSAGVLTPNVKFTYAAGQTIADVSNIAINGISLDFTASASANLTMAGVAQSNFDMTVLCAPTAPCLIQTGTVANNGYGNNFPYLGLAGGSGGIRMQPGSGREWTVNYYGVVHIGALSNTVGTFTAMDFNGPCDTQHFENVGFWANAAVTSANGVILNSGSTTTDTDANSIVIEMFSTTSLNFTTGTGITFNPSTGNYIKTGVMNWTNSVPAVGIPACPSAGSVACIATGGVAAEPSGVWITLDARGLFTTIYSGVKYAPVVPTTVTKDGSGAGNYSTATTASFVVVDATNQALTTVVPLGMQLDIRAIGACTQSVGADQNGMKIAILDGATVLKQVEITTPAASSLVNYALQATIIGDGNSHTVQLGFATSNAAHAVVIQNGGTEFNPSMKWTLQASN